ncbi:DUF1102 domain-containing protein [Halalkalirubrum salinum]|uniref:DUF1102 domain-containing protein n=1 Tax=Halalkalirubrum salinum TaxID=2563889 RepID=UPI0010FAE5AE|nr:DUF1102 domain-containing protein [Halalkalirubrum salinum]
MSRTVRSGFLILALLSGLSFAAATGAVSVGPGDLLPFDENQEPAGEVRLYPTTDNSYSSIDEETGELVVDIGSSDRARGEGVNADGTTDIETVFYVNYESNESDPDPAAVWITHDGDTEAVQFVSENRTIMSEDSTVLVDAGENTSIGVRINTQEVEDSESLIDNMQIHAKVPEDSNP